MNITNKIKNNVRDVKDFPKKGIVFKDITPILKNPVLCDEIKNELSSHVDSKTTHIAGIESRGFIFGLPVSIHKNISFVLIRKKGKLPYKTIALDYDLEYGKSTIEMNINDVGYGDKVLIHDDLLATGGTAAAAAQLILSQGAEIAGFSFVIELGFLNGRKNLYDFSNNIKTIVKY